MDYEYEEFVASARRRIREQPDNAAFTKAVAEIASKAQLPWWAFLRKSKAHIDRDYILRYAEIGAVANVLKCAHGVGADKEAIRGVAMLIYGRVTDWEPEESNEP